MTTLENWRPPQQLNLHVPYDTEIPVLALFPRGMGTHFHKEPGTLIFLAAEYFALILQTKAYLKYDTSLQRNYYGEYFHSKKNV